VTTTSKERSTGEKVRILVVDDEPQITRVLKTTLSLEGYAVETAENGEAAQKLVERWEPELVITDLAMPQMDGIELSRWIRERWQMPVLVLSVRDQEAMKVRALDAGADDYVTKPFNMNELLARVRSLLRRGGKRAEEIAQPVTVGDFEIDPEKHEVKVRGKEVRLTPKEFKLLLYMAQHADRVLTHRKLLTAIWGSDNAQQPEYLRVFLGQIRKKLETDERHYILTEPWVGYRFEPAGRAPEDGE
jgi:two-component system, OmpR family, KDP operon response regulator KdpE